MRAVNNNNTTVISTTSAIFHKKALFRLFRRRAGWICHSLNLEWQMPSLQVCVYMCVSLCVWWGIGEVLVYIRNTSADYYYPVTYPWWFKRICRKALLALYNWPRLPHVSAYALHNSREHEFTQTMMRIWCSWLIQGLEWPQLETDSR